MTHGELIRVTADQGPDLPHQIATAESHKRVQQTNKQFHKIK